MDDILNAIPALIALLPDPWPSIAITLLALGASLAGLLAVVKPLVKIDANTPVWKVGLLSVLDYVAANSTPWKAKLELAQKEKQIAKTEAHLHKALSLPPVTYTRGLNEEEGP